MSNLRVRPSLEIADLDILLDGMGNIKFSDFGAAKVFAKQGKTKAGVTMARTNLNSMTGTPMYMSPEGTNFTNVANISHHGFGQRPTWRSRHLVSRLLHPRNGNRSSAMGQSRQ
jgi:serine/threonine protein kinase